MRKVLNIGVLFMLLVSLMWGMVSVNVLWAAEEGAAADTAAPQTKDRSLRPKGAESGSGAAPESEMEGQNAQKTAPGMSQDSAQSLPAGSEALKPDDAAAEQESPVVLPPTAVESLRPPPSAPQIEPLFVHALTPIRASHNDSNPLWSPSGEMLAFERAVGDTREIVLAHRNGTIVQTIYFLAPEEAGSMNFFFPGVAEKLSYNAGLSWSSDGHGLVFMSNGGSGNYDLYLLPKVGSSDTLRLTRHPAKDSHPHWSPKGQKLVFVSGRTGKADIFILDMASGQRRQLTRGPKMYLYPQWSPDGQSVAMIYGSNENHDIYVIRDLAHPFESLKALTTWEYDDLRPIWSPDGSKIAFYSNYNEEGDPKSWSIVVVPADGSGPRQGPDLAACVVARQVVPDIEQGPAWMPESQHIVYVKNDEQAFNPIFMVHLEDKVPTAVMTRTKMNHDVACAPDGTLAFRAQVEQWDHIHIAKLNLQGPSVEAVQ